MLFDFLKKKNYADAIYTDLHLITDDKELESCTWLSVKDGRIQIIGEGDTYGDLKGKDTVMYDLGGRWLGAGLREPFADPAEQVLSGMFLKASPDWTLDRLLQELDAFAKTQTKAGFCLVWNVPSALFAKKQQASENEGEEASDPYNDRINQVSNGLPVILMFEDGISLRLNTAAVELVTARADAIGATTVSPELALDAVISMDYEAQAKCFMEQAFEKAVRGVTAVTGTASNSYFDKLYRDLLINAVSCGMLKQKYYGSYPLHRMFNPQTVLFSLNKAKTDCLELGGKLDYTSITVDCSSDKNSSCYFTADYLKALALDTADRGYGMRVRTFDRDAALMAIQVLGEISDSYKKLTWLVLHDQHIAEEDRSRLYLGNVIEGSLSQSQRGGRNFVQATEEAASLMGLPREWGLLTEGAPADLAVFDFDPRGASNVDLIPAYMTILDGAPVYTKGKDDPNAWTTVMKEHLDTIAGDFDFALQEEEQPQA